MGFPGGAGGKKKKKNRLPMQETQETQAQSVGLEDLLEEGTGNPLECSCLENPMYRGAWQAMVHRVAKSWT